MRRALVVAACLGACLPARAPAAPRAPVAACLDEETQQPDERSGRLAWRGRITEWLRRHVRGDGEERVLYYLRSPLLQAFGPEPAADCDGPPPPAARRCADVIIETNADAQLEMEVELPQLGAHTARSLEISVRRALQSGEQAIVHDRDGNELVIYPTLTRRVRVEACG